MKLLFDQNLAPSLVKTLGDLFPGSRHVSDVSLEEAPDGVVWNFAAAEGFVLVSKDRDFAALSVRLGSPPQFVWIGTGNSSTAAIAHLLRANGTKLRQGGASADGAPLKLGPSWLSRLWAHLATFLGGAV